MGLLCIIALGFYFVTSAITKYTGYSIFGEKYYSSIQLESLAKCMTENNVVLYASSTCPHCKAQKDLFKDAVQHLNITECIEEPEKCNGLLGVPAWMINGKLVYGEQTIEQLDELSGCEIN